MYGMPHWWTQEAIMNRNLHDQLILFTLDPARGVALLEGSGWTLNSQGQPFDPDVDDVRYKDVTDVAQLPNALPFEDDRNVIEVDGRLLMRLQIEWATWPTDANRITEIFEILVPSEMEAIGMAINPNRLGNPLVHLSRAEDPEPTFHLFNQGQTFAPQIYSPWNWVNPDLLGSGNVTWTSDPDLFDAVNPMRFVDKNTEEGREAFVELFIDAMIALNYAALEIPLYADIWYDFIPNRLQNWHNNSVWGFDHAIVRAYVLY